jgi:O-antigen/teichoic acid export membrane protein
MVKLFENNISKLRSSPYFRNEFFRKFTSVLGVDIMVKASGFILLPFFLRLMTQDEFGLYNYLISIVQTFSLVLNLGLYIPQSKLYHSYVSKNEKGSLLFTIFLTLLVFLGIVSVLTVIFGLDYKVIKILFNNQLDYTNYRGLVFLSLLITVLSFMLTNFFYTSEKIKEVRVYNLCRIVAVNLLALLALYLLKKDAVQTRIEFTYLTEFALILIFARYLIKELVPRFNLRLMQKSLRMGLPIMVSAIFGIVVNFSDKFLLQKYGTLTNLSNYYLALSFASIIPLIFASLQNVWLPIFFKEKDLEKNFKKTRSMGMLLLISFLVLAAFIWLLFLVLVRTSVIPGKYQSVVFILPILLIAQIFIAITSLLSNYLIYFEKTFLASVSGLIVSVISVGLGLWLVPLWNVYGAAVTTLAVNMIYAFIYYHIIRYFKNQKRTNTVRQAKPELV